MQIPQHVDIPAAGEPQMSLDAVRGQSHGVPTHTREGSSTQMLSHDGIVELLRKTLERWRLILDSRRNKYGSVADEFPRGFTPEESRLQWNREYKQLEEEAQALRDGASTTSSGVTRCSDSTGTNHLYDQRVTSRSPSTSYRSSLSPASQTPPSCNLSNPVRPTLGIEDSYENTYCTPSETRSQEHVSSRRKRSYDTMIEDPGLFPVCKRSLDKDSRQAHDPQGTLHVETPPRSRHAHFTRMNIHVEHNQQNRNLTDKRVNDPLRPVERDAVLADFLSPSICTTQSSSSHLRDVRDMHYPRSVKRPGHDTDTQVHMPISTGRLRAASDHHTQIGSCVRVSERASIPLVRSPRCRPSCESRSFAGLGPASHKFGLVRNNGRMSSLRVARVLEINPRNIRRVIKVHR